MSAGPPTPAIQPAFRATQSLPCTPSDTTVQPFAALYIGSSGDVVIEDLYGNQSTFTAHPIGYLLCGGIRVMAATGASLINLLN